MPSTFSTAMAQGFLGRLSVASLLCLAVTASQAHADWQYTHWGMSVSEVRAAAPDPVAEAPEGGAASPLGVVRLAAAYQAMGLEGRVAFAFQEDSLSAVVFAFVGKDDERVLFLLQDRYGAPVSSPAPDDRRELVWLWRDDPSGNNVRYIHFPGSLDPDMIVYTPIHSAGSGGL